MRKFFVFVFSALLVTGCGGSGSFEDGLAPASCSNTEQKQYVLDALYAWYLWNDLLPSNINIADYATPEELVTQVTRTYGPRKPDGSPLDRFSYVTSAESDQQFFGEGRFEGFGFSWRFEASEMRITRVFSGSPAAIGGLERGLTVLSLNDRAVADISADEGISAFFDANNVVDFELRRLDNTVFNTGDIAKDIVTITPVPQSFTIPIGEGLPPIGYMELATFISTAEPVFDDVFAEFVAAGVKDVIIDMRYNGGGLVRTAELLGDYLGGFANDGLVFSSTEYNADRADRNSSSFFARLGNSIDISRVIIIASGGTASASELVTNSMFPYADVWIVGDNTFGKPVGQIGLDFCDKILRPTAFKTTNANRDGDYFDGLPVDCAAADSLDVAVGADNDPNIVAARSIAETGACPVVSMPNGQQAAEVQLELRYPELTGSPAREFAGAY